MIKISFSDDVKKEVLNYVNDKDKEFACLYGMVLFSRSVTRERICFQTESNISAETFSKLMKSVFGANVSFMEHTRKNGNILYCCEVNDLNIMSKVCQSYRITDGELNIDSEIISTGSLGVFTGGVFLACGSINNPNKDYHLEFTVNSEGLKSGLVSLLGDIGVNAKTVVRRGQNVIYVKASESIEDILTFIGSQQCTIELINIKIFKDVRNKANRIANCDNANIDKTLKASMKQIEDIEIIKNTKGFEFLSDELREVAELRLANTDMSLQEIGESLTEPISRSGVSHRFKKIAKIAEEIRGEG